MDSSGFNIRKFDSRTSLYEYCLPRCTGSWWSYQMETFSALLALSEGNSPVTGEFPHGKGQWRGALMFCLVCAWTSGLANNRDAIALIMTSQWWFNMFELARWLMMADHLFGAIAFATTMVIYANRYQVGIKIGKKSRTVIIYHCCKSLKGVILL